MVRRSHVALEKHRIRRYDGVAVQAGKPMTVRVMRRSREVERLSCFNPVACEAWFSEPPVVRTARRQRPGPRQGRGTRRRLALDGVARRLGSALLTAECPWPALVLGGSQRPATKRRCGRRRQTGCGAVWRSERSMARNETQNAFKSHLTRCDGPGDGVGVRAVEKNEMREVSHSPSPKRKKIRRLVLKILEDVL